MSELIDNSVERVGKLKTLLLDMHKGVSLDDTKKKLVELLGSVPYGEVVQAEQELIEEGLPSDEIQKYCDLHSIALKGQIDTSNVKTISEGHPIHTFQMENKEILIQTNRIKEISIKINSMTEKAIELLHTIHGIFNSLMDIEKHYSRKENLIFSFLEKHNITGPPKVMWGKDDEVRTFLKSSIELLKSEEDLAREEVKGFFELVFNPTINAIEEMIYKEENILFPMCLDTFTQFEWYEIYQQSDEMGYCLYDPQVKWQPDFVKPEEQKQRIDGRIQLSTGSFLKEELEAIFKTTPFDLTFVDKEDKVRFFSSGKERIFQRSRAILGREVQYCHPPASVHIVEQILDDFKSKKQDEAVFWINHQGKYILIAYYAVRNEKGDYIGTLEVTQDISDIKKIEGERRLLTYTD